MADPGDTRTAEELTAPLANTARVRFYVDYGVTAQAAVPGTLASIRGLEFQLDGQSELETADSGYQPGMGPKAEYQAGYRDGFRRAYRQGWDEAKK